MTLTKEDEALYDRQIRLWGVAAQQRIRQSTVVVAGHFTGVAQELVKNLVLKGVGRVLLLSWCNELPAGYSTEALLFPPERTAGALSNTVLAAAIIQQAGPMNPSVDLAHKHVDLANIESSVGEAAMLVLVNETRLDRAVGLNGICRRLCIPFEWIVTRGMEALLINDLGSTHSYIEEVKKTVNGETTTESTSHTLDFATLPQLWEAHRETGKTWTPPRRATKSQPSSYSPKFAAWQDDLERVQNVEECAPVNAIMGAIAAQEVIKVATGRDRPIHNVVLFEGSTLDSTIVSISP